MLHREAKVRIEYAGARAFFGGRDDDQAAVDLVPPVHPRGILLADIATLGEADAVQLGRVAFEPEALVAAQLGNALGDAQAEPVLQPALCGIGRRREPAAA